MEGFGNVLMCFKVSEQGLALVEQMLLGHLMSCQRVENVFYILIPPTAPDEVFAAVTEELKKMNIVFVFYFIALSDRAKLRIKGLPLDQAKKIKDILINNN